MEKRDLRKKCFAALREISEDEKAAESKTICRFLSELPAFQSASVLLSYIPLRNEPDLMPLFLTDKTWGFSVVKDDDTLTFRQVDSPEKQLCEGDFGILEPVEQSCPKIDLDKVDMVLVPGVGFDPKTGARLGRGKGHYDRFLSAFLKQREGSVTPQIVGVAFSQQLCDLNPEPHDIPMEILLTGLGVDGDFHC